MPHFLTAVFSNTPLWVWAILAALLALGVKQAQDHVVGRTRLLLQPLVLGALSVVSALGAFGLQPHTAGGWLIGALAGVLLNRMLGLPRRVQALPDGRFAIGGSWAPMVLLMAIFWLRYAVAVSLAMSPALRADTLFALLACALYGLASGLIGARAWRVLRTTTTPALAGLRLAAGSAARAGQAAGASLAGPAAG